MALRPIAGAPADAPIPDFPTGDPAPLDVRDSRLTHRPVEVPSAPPPARRSGPIELRGDGDSTITFRCYPEVPAINRASMTVSIAGEIILDLATDKAKAFLLALRDGDPPIVAADSRTGSRVEFANAADGPGFTVSGPRTARRFNAGGDFDVKAMAADLLAELGP